MKVEGQRLEVDLDPGWALPSRAPMTNIRRWHVFGFSSTEKVFGRIQACGEFCQVALEVRRLTGFVRGRIQLRGVRRLVAAFHRSLPSSGSRKALTRQRTARRSLTSTICNP